MAGHTVYITLFQLLSLYQLLTALMWDCHYCEQHAA